MFLLSLLLLASSMMKLASLFLQASLLLVECWRSCCCFHSCCCLLFCCCERSWYCWFQWQTKRLLVIELCERRRPCCLKVLLVSCSYCSRRPCIMHGVVAWCPCCFCIFFHQCKKWHPMWWNVHNMSHSFQGLDEFSGMEKCERSPSRQWKTLPATGKVKIPAAAGKSNLYWRRLFYPLKW